MTERPSMPVDPECERLVGRFCNSCLCNAEVPGYVVGCRLAPRPSVTVVGVDFVCSACGEIGDDMNPPIGDEQTERFIAQHLRYKHPERPSSQPEQVVFEALLAGMPLRRSPLELAQDVLDALTEAGYWVVPLVGLTPTASDQS